jgi:hypothetical protein
MDTLPSNVTYVGSTASQGSCSGTTTVICSLGTINSSETGTPNTATVTITVIPTAAGALSNNASVGATSTGSTSATAAPAATAVSAAAGAAAGTGSVVTTYVKPVTATGAASKIRKTRAYLSALVNPAGQATSYTIQTRRNGTSRWISAKGRKLTAATAVDHVAMTISHLRSGRKYSFRVEATSGIGTSYGQVRSFTTTK